MHFSKSVVAIASLAAYASAQDTPAGSVKVHVIQAMNTAEGKPVFEPAEVQAAVGDLIQFQFHPANHSVVRAAFADPCVPIEESASGNGTAGFYSGYMPIAPNSDMMPTFTIPVENDRPIWFYCSQAKHCQNGMVGVINPTAERTLADFTSRAAEAAENRAPGQEDVGSGGVDAPTNGTTTDGSPTTMETSRVTNTATATGTNLVPTGAASRVSSSIALALAGVAASFFLL